VPDDPFARLQARFKGAAKQLKQLSQGGFKKTVIVHPQLGKDASEAQELASDWQAREEKQLLDNVTDILG